MTPEQAVDVILAIFKTQWDTLGTPAGSYPAVYPDVPSEVPTTETVWAKASVYHATGGQSSLTGAIGTKRYTNKGLVWIQIFAPVGGGNVLGYTAAQVVVNAYRDADTSILFRNVTPPVEMGAEGAFTRFDVKAEFEYDEVR